MLKISFELSIENEVSPQNMGHTRTYVCEEVPEGVDPRIYLRDRVLREFGITVSETPPPANDTAITDEKVEIVKSA